MSDKAYIEIVPQGEKELHERGDFCPCKPIVEPGETPTVAHRPLLTPETTGRAPTAVRRD